MTTTFENHQTPTRRERLIFALIQVLLGTILASLIVYRSGVIINAAVVTSALFVMASLFRWRGNLYGAIVPVILVVLALEIRDGHDHGLLAATTLAIFVTLALLTAFRSDFGGWFYLQWMKAVEPLGWSFSCLLFASVYFALVTPIGWLLRCFRYDPLNRQFDRKASSYWIERKQAPSVERYFRQF